jgi:hypothetical protein
MLSTVCHLIDFTPDQEFPMPTPAFPVWIDAKGANVPPYA